jgi:hypothetical protein
MAKHTPHDKPEHPIFMVGAFAVAVLVFVTLVWLMKSPRIVAWSLSPSISLGSMWLWLPLDYGTMQWNTLVASAQMFAANTADVSIFQWGEFISQALRPVAMLIMLGYFVLVFFTVSSVKSYTRRFTADSLLELNIKKFSGVAPVATIRGKIAKDQLPLWRRQVVPDEVFNNYRVPKGKATSAINEGAPMVQNGVFNKEVARVYFMGVEKRFSDGRLESRMLGRQIVDVMNDSARLKSVVFADRMSNEGKTVMALWASVVFGGVEGIKEYCEYRDKLNYSAYGTENGMANLALAGPLYEKYRKHPMMNRIFAVFHWEHTALFALLALAQKKGRYTTAEVLWLRPTNRVMYFALNTRGSFTPHTESGMTFAQHAYELGCAKHRRLPLMRTPSGAVHVIYTDKVVEGLAYEHAQWMDALPDDEDWWLTNDVWRGTKASVEALFIETQKQAIPTGPMPHVAADYQSDFDNSALMLYEKAKKEEDEARAHDLQQEEVDPMDALLAGGNPDF